jgi:uncharacterized protein (UPF0261 family)
VNEEKIDPFAAAVASAKTAGAVAMVELPSGGAVFFKRPTFAQWEEMASYKDTPEEQRAFDRYVVGCMVSACDAKGEPLTEEQVKEREGFLFFLSACGPLINQMGGVKAAKATFL